MSIYVYIHVYSNYYVNKRKRKFQKYIIYKQKQLQINK